MPQMALDRLGAWGPDCMDLLTAAAHAPEPLETGQRYWAWHALTALQTGRSARRLAEMLRDPVASELEAHIERGALLIVRVCACVCTC